MDQQIDRITVLANGEAVSLRQAAAVFGRLQSYLEGHDVEWDVAYLLREVCLVRSIAPEHERALIREDLLSPDGGVDPVVRAVVLSAVRGEGRTLHVSSPFTDPLDRHIAEFLAAREYLTTFLEGAEARAWMEVDTVRNALREAADAVPESPTPPEEVVRRVLQKWVNRVESDADVPTAPPTPPRP